MTEGSPQRPADELAQENERLRAALEEIRSQIEPFLDRKAPPPPERLPERQVVHDVRNILNELGLLRALVPGDDVN